MSYVRTRSLEQSGARALVPVWGILNFSQGTSLMTTDDPLLIADEDPGGDAADDEDNQSAKILRNSSSVNEEVQSTFVLPASISKRKAESDIKEQGESAFHGKNNL